MNDERKVKFVEEPPIPETPTLYEIPYIGTLKVMEADDYPDTFRKPVEEVNELQGTSPVFKRNVTNTLKKRQVGVGGAGTKQIHEKTFETGYDAFDVIEPPYNLAYLAKLYEVSSTHYAACNAKVSNIVGLGFNLVENRKTKKKLEDISEDEKRSKKARQVIDEERDNLLDALESFNEEDTFVEILTKVWRDYETMGNAYLEIGRKKDGSIGYVGHVPARTIRIRRERDGFVQLSGMKIQFFAHFGAGMDKETGSPKRISNPVGNGTPNEIIHFKKYSPNSGYYGIPDIMAASQAVAGNEFAHRFNLDYFEHKAIPRYAIILKGATLGTQAQQSLLSMFEGGLKGANHRSVFIPLPPDTDQQKVSIEFEAIEAGKQDSSFAEYHKSNDIDILMAHRVPITKVSVASGASVATARDADKTFKEQVCAPEQAIAEKKINGIIKELSDAFDFKLNQMTLTDEDTQSKIDERNVKAGIDLPNEIRARKGQPGVKGGNERVDLNAKDKAAAAAKDANANRQRNSTRSAQGTDSNGEARNPKGEGRTTP
jgi:PBSX family phage portal protein